MKVSNKITIVRRLKIACKFFCLVLITSPLFSRAGEPFLRDFFRERGGRWEQAKTDLREEEEDWEKDRGGEEQEGKARTAAMAAIRGAGGERGNGRGLRRERIILEPPPYLLRP